MLAADGFRAALVDFDEGRFVFAEVLVALAERVAKPAPLPASLGLFEQRRARTRCRALERRVRRLLSDERDPMIHMNGLAKTSLTAAGLAIAATALLFHVRVAGEDFGGARGGQQEQSPTLADLADGEPASGIQAIKPLPVRVVDPNGQPLPRALVTPWALRSSQGHGPWLDEDDRSGVEPKAAITKEDGQATVAYPYFRDVHEGTRTNELSIFVDHPDFASPDWIFIPVPHEEDSPYEVKLVEGVSVELRPTILGRAADTEDLFAFWSDGRSWRSRDSVERTARSTLRLPPLKPGSHSVLVARLDGDRVTHFSEILDFDVSLNDGLLLDVALEPAEQIEGVLSDNVPRPVTNGRISFSRLAPGGESDSRIPWFSWVSIRPDGTFTIEAWPPGETIQLIALCDGFIAQSGEAPAAVVNPRSGFKRPQVFDPSDPQPITVQMEPLVKCIVTAMDEDNTPVSGITVVSWPHVSWWNSGSKIYCYPLVRSERRLRVRDYFASIDEDFPQPFQATTDRSGRATLYLPKGAERLTVDSHLYEMPILLGHRDVSVELTAGETTEIALRLQPRGTERLGEWDKLAGVVFGCSTAESRRIAALPEVRKKMDEFIERFRDAKNQNDPKLLSEAYTIVADAFAAIDDSDEAAKWYRRAAEQAAKAQAASGEIR